MQDNEKLYAVLVERADGEQIAFIPDEEVDWSVSAWRRNPGQDETRWTEVVTAEVAEDEEPFWDDSHADLARGPVAVLVSESDQEQIARNGRSKPLLQKLVRALDKVDGLNGLSAETPYPTLRGMVQNQRNLAAFEVDGRRAKSDQPVEDAQEEPLEAEEVLQDDVRSGDAASGSTHLLVPDAALGKSYVSRHVDGVEDMAMLDYALEERDNVLLYGPTQSGKTTLPIAHAARNGRACYAVSGTVALEPSQLFGKYVPDEEGGFRWVDGPVTSLVRHGGTLILDEANTISPKIMTTLYPLTDSRREISLLDHEGEVIRAHKDLLIVATCNLGYQGTLPMSEAFLDRFAHRHHWDYSAEVEDKLVKSETLLKMARQIRKEGDIRSPFSTSLLKAFERLAASKLGWDYAVGNLLGRFTDAEDREAVKALLDLRTQKIKEELGLVEVPKPVRSEDIPEHPKTSREWREIMSTWS